jgi:hypothetical protein
MAGSQLTPRTLALLLLSGAGFAGALILLDVLYRGAATQWLALGGLVTVIGGAAMALRFVRQHQRRRAMRGLA